MRASIGRHSCLNILIFEWDIMALFIGIYCILFYVHCVSLTEKVLNVWMFTYRGKQSYWWKTWFSLIPNT